MAGESVLELTDDNFETQVLKSDKPVLVDFWAEWCMPCRMIAPTIDELAREFSGKVKVGKVDTDANRNVSVQFQINLIPTILLFNNGQVVHKFVGVTQKQEFIKELNKLTSVNA